MASATSMAGEKIVSKAKPVPMLTGKPDCVLSLRGLGLDREMDGKEICMGDPSETLEAGGVLYFEDVDVLQKLLILSRSECVFS